MTESPEALSPEELVKLENLVLDNPLGLASLRGGLGGYLNR